MSEAVQYLPLRHSGRCVQTAAMIKMTMVIHLKQTAHNSGATFNSLSKEMRRNLSLLGADEESGNFLSDGIFKICVLAEPRISAGILVIKIYCFSLWVQTN